MPPTKLLEVNRRIDVAAFELGRCLEEVDAIVSPTTPQAAPAFGGPSNDMPAHSAYSPIFREVRRSVYQWDATKQVCLLVCRSSVRCIATPGCWRSPNPMRRQPDSISSRRNLVEARPDQLIISGGAGSTAAYQSAICEPFMNIVSSRASNTSRMRLNQFIR